MPHRSGNDRQDEREGGRRPILVLTAGMGEGHNGVARELQRRLEGAGHTVEVIDVLDVMPLRTGRLMRLFYSAMVRYAPWLYDFIYAVWFRPSGRRRGGPVSPVTRPIRQHVARWIETHEPLVAVSTFHLCSQVLGHLRQSGTLRAPSVSVIVDMAVHKLWVHPGVDHHLCYHPAAAAVADQRGAAGVSAPGPVVRRELAEPAWVRESARRALGLTAEDRVVLVAGGSWGVGQLKRAVESISRSGRFHVIAVCGHNTALRRRLSGIDRVIATGWVEDMAQVLIAADALVDNAGGLTSMESLAVGTPVVCERPLPGHGRANIAAMVAAGIVCDASADLLGALDAVTARGSHRDSYVDAGRRMFVRDAADEIILAASSAKSPTRSRSTS